MLTTIWQILLFVVVLSFLVIIHELGHYLVAKWRKVRVEEFGIGYPPLALKLFTIGETIFSLNWIPFGGFVRLEGEEGPEPEKLIGETMTANAKQKVGLKKSPALSELAPFYRKSMGSRLAIILAGATVNMIFGIVAFAIYFSVKGIPELLPDPRIGAVAPNSPVAMAQVPTQVNITGFSYQNVVYKMETVDEVIAFVGSHSGQSVTMLTSGNCVDAKCDPTQHQYQLTIRSKENIPAGQGALGLQFDQVISSHFYPWYQMPFRGTKIGLEQALLLSQLILVSLWGILSGLFHGVVPSDVAGPVGIFTQARQAGFFSGDLFELLNLAGKLSVNLAIMNVLPIPALDGGRALFILLEPILKRRRIAKVEGYVNYIAFGLLLLLTVVITFKDVINLVIKK